MPDDAPQDTRPVAHQLWDAMRDHARIEGEADDALLLAAGIDPEAPAAWPLSNIVYDDYDGSFEFKGVTPGWVPDFWTRVEWGNLGFVQCWICHTDGTEKHYAL